MLLLTLSVLFLLGLFVGSFLNVVADRMLKEEQFIRGRSKCDSCGKVLKALDLIPILSFVFNRGKCRYCGTSLSSLYPISEFTTGFFFVLAYLFANGDLYTFIFLLVIFCIYIIIFLTDLKEQLIPDILVLTGVIISAFYYISNSIYTLYSQYQGLMSTEFGPYLVSAGIMQDKIVQELYFLGGLAGSSIVIYLFFLFLIVVTKGRGMGGGDMKLGFLIGLVNGLYYNFLAIFLGFFVGSIFSIFYVLFGKKTVKDVIPFGPFLIIGSVISLGFGPQILEWYLNYFL